MVSGVRLSSADRKIFFDVDWRGTDLGQGLQVHDLVWRRPWPVRGPEDAAKALKLGKIRASAGGLPAAEVADI